MAISSFGEGGYQHRLRLGARTPTRRGRRAGHALDDTPTLRRAFKRALKSAGVDPRYRLHDLRAQFAVALAQQGADIETVRRALRHKSITPTVRYLRHIEGHVENAVRKLVLPAVAQ